MLTNISFGVSCLSLDIFKSYLLIRERYTNYEGNTFALNKINYGVSWGYITGL